MSENGIAASGVEALAHAGLRLRSLSLCRNWLDAEDSVLAERIGAHDHHRPPLLAGAPDAAAETRAVRARRGPTFARLADVTLDTGGDPENLLQELVDAATG